tara:strand:+ start:331 stop:492 length:162 start_codon:yes stop_codon:yes gene_type:complete
MVLQTSLLVEQVEVELEVQVIVILLELQELLIQVVAEVDLLDYLILVGMVVQE